MIEINLLPGVRRKSKRGGAPRLDMAGAIASIRERVREPWLFGSIGVGVITFGIVYWAFLGQIDREDKYYDDEDVIESARYRYKRALVARDRVEAKRDTVLRAINIIRAIDDDRYLWTHVMDEVSRALPPYTWLLSLGFSGTGQAQAPIATLAPITAKDTLPNIRVKRKPLGTVVIRDTVRIRLVGNTVDIQALTRFYRQLEQSPYFEQVQLAKSERANDNGKEVTQFQLDLLYSRPDSTYTRRVPMTGGVR